nr:hypothetical protein BaRGS_020887 [Batillaria attramentaria]
MLTKIGEAEVHVSPHRSLNSSKGVVRDEALAYLSDEELKKQPKMVSSACQTDPIVETFTFKGRQKPPQQQKTTSTPAVVVVDSPRGSGCQAGGESSGTSTGSSAQGAGSGDVTQRQGSGGIP